MTARLTRSQIEANAERIRPFIRPTPVMFRSGHEISVDLDPATEIVFKLELFQFTGTFKARGAVTNLLSLTPEEKARGVTAVSAGNHAVAVAYAASILSVDAKLVMTANASPARIAAARAYGAEILLTDTIHAAFARGREIATEEGRTLIHPFDGENVALGTASLGLEFAAEAGPLDAVVVAIGGGGLAGGVAAAFKLVQPDCEVIGVEPEGADTMHRSFAANVPRPIEKVATIADSLGAPTAMPYSFELYRANLDRLAMVNDDQLCEAMALMFSATKLAVEPAAAAPLAALRGPLREDLSGKRVGLIVCGSNIDIETFATLVRRGTVERAT